MFAGVTQKKTKCVGCYIVLKENVSRTVEYRDGWHVFDCPIVDRRLS